MFSIQNFVKTYSIRPSKTGPYVPIVNDIPLHSLDNPVEEAQNLVDSYKKQLEKNPSALVLGLGFGYHIKELQQTLLTIHGLQSSLAIIDPCKCLFNDFSKHFSSTNDTASISFFINESIDSLYKTQEVVEFLQKGPVIITHPPSFKLYNHFFKQFLSYQAPTSLHEYMDQINDKDLRKHLISTISDNPNTTLFQYAQSLHRQKRKLKKYDHLVLALHEEYTDH